MRPARSATRGSSMSCALSWPSSRTGRVQRRLPDAIDRLPPARPVEEPHAKRTLGPPSWGGPPTLEPVDPLRRLRRDAPTVTTARPGIRAAPRCPWYRAMPPMNKEIPMRKRTLLTALFLVALAAVLAATATAATDGKKNASKKANSPVQVQVFAPRSGDVAGKQSKGFLVDLALRYPSLAASGADFQLTGPTTHQNQAPFPGTFSAGVDEK